MSKQKRIFTAVIFTVYILIVLYLTVIRSGLRRYDEPQLNLLPLADLVDVFINAGIGTFLYLFLGNIFWFIPLGFFLPFLLKIDKLPIIIVCGFSFSLAIEVTQYFTRKGIAEIDDLILNVLGTIIGWLVYRLIFTRKSTSNTLPQ